MKYLRKIVIAVLLLSYALPLSTSLAADYYSTNNEDELDIIAEYYAMATVSEADDCYSLPHRDIFINSFPLLENTALSGVQREIEVWDNGFSYEDGYSVQTRGQVNVPAAKAVTDYDDFEGRMEQELAIMEQYYPEATILLNPTSKYNCHSYAWCETAEMSERWIPEAELFLRDVHTFKPVAETDAQEGDIVLYFDVYGKIAHSAVISQVRGSVIRCISKWGASALCEHELTYVPDTYKSNGICDTLVVRRTPHTGSIQPSGSGQHTLSCTICGHAFTTDCDYTYSYLGNDTHSGHCLECNSTANDACSITVTYNDNGTHTRSCNNCSNSYTEICSLEYTNLTNTRHSVACTVCDYSVNSQLCTLTYTSNGNQTHTVTCTLCDKTRNVNCSLVTEYDGSNQHYSECNKCGAGVYGDCVNVHTYCGDETLGDVHMEACITCGNTVSDGTESCTFAYQYYGQVDGSNAHVYACTVCDHIDSGPTLCTYIGTKPCLQCGSVKGQVSINTSEEELAD